MSFTNVFGGSTLQASDVAYRALALIANVTLVWPQNSLTGIDYLAKITEVTPSQSGFNITLPPANQVSNGADVLFTNPSAFSYNVVDAAGGAVVTVGPGQQVMVYVAANTTVAGTWRSFLYGAASTTLSAAAVQGLGVQAVGNTLNAAHLVSSISSNTAIASTDRAVLYLWTGGAGAITLPQAASVGNTFFFEVRNQGTGVLTISAAASEFVDATATISLQPTESCMIHSSGIVNWYTVGRGRSTQFNFTQLNKTVTGGSASLTITEASSIVQKYAGALTANQVVVLPAVIQVYYVSNQTTGSFTLTFQSPTPGTSVTVGANQNAILFCDGTNVINSSTAAGNTSLSIAQGSASTPTISVAGNGNTGIFQPVTNTLSVTANGVEVSRFTATGLNQTAIGATTPSTGSFTTLTVAAFSPSTVIPIANGGTAATTVTAALASLGVQSAANGSFIIPVGTTAQRDASPVSGYLRYNQTSLKFEGYSSGAWGSIGGGSGATGSGQDNVFVENDKYQTTSYTLGQSGLTPCVISIATPGVVTQANTFVGGEEVFFQTTGALPTGLAANTTYFVLATGLTSSTFQVSTIRGGSATATSGTQSGNQTAGKAKSAQMVGPLTVATGAVIAIPTGQRLVIQ